MTKYDYKGYEIDVKPNGTTVVSKDGEPRFVYHYESQAQAAVDWIIAEENKRKAASHPIDYDAAKRGAPPTAYGEENKTMTLHPIDYEAAERQAKEAATIDYEAAKRQAGET